MLELLQKGEDVVLADSSGVRQAAAGKHELFVHFWARVQELGDDVKETVLASEEHSAQRVELILQELENPLSDLGAVPLLQLGLESRTFEPGELDLCGRVLFAHGLEVCLHIGTVIEAQLLGTVRSFENLLV